MPETGGGNNPNFGQGNNGAVTSTYKSNGSPDDFSTWTWKQIEAAITGIAAARADDTSGFSNAGQVSNPGTLYEAANALENVKRTLQMVGKSIQDQADALSLGDNAPWKGAAADAFNLMMSRFSKNVLANAQVLVGDVSASDIPIQIYQNGQRLETAIRTIHDIDVWYAAQAARRGATVRDGLVMVSEDQEVVQMMTRDMRQVITELSRQYSVTNDGFTPPSADSPPTPNSDPRLNPPPGGLNTDLPQDTPNPFGDGPGGPGSGGGTDFNPPEVESFTGGGDLGGGGLGDGGPGGGGLSAFTPPPVGEFPGGGGDPGGAGLGGPGGGGLGDGGLSAFTPPPASEFPGGGAGGLGGGVGGLGAGLGGFVPPPVGNFPGGAGSLGTVGGKGVGGGDLFKDKSGLDTSGLGAESTLPPAAEFPGGVGGGSAGGATGLGAGGLDAAGLGAGGLDAAGLDQQLETNAPSSVAGFPGLGDGSAGGGIGGADGMGAGMPMMPPPMGGMGGAPPNAGSGKSDASGLLDPTLFPGGLDDGTVAPSTLLTGGTGTSGGGGGLSGLDGQDSPADGGGIAEESGVDDSGAGVPVGSEMPMMPMMPPPMGGMGGAAPNAGSGKSDASGLLSQAMFPGGLDGHTSDPSALLESGSGAVAGAGVLSGLPAVDSPDAGDEDRTTAEPPRHDRVAVVQGNHDDEDFDAWSVGGTAAAALPWLLGRGGRRRDERNAPTEASPDVDKRLQSEAMATWRPDRSPGAPVPPGATEIRSSFAEPDPEPDPEPEPDIAGDDGEAPERTSADLLDRRSDQWDNQASGLPRVLG